MKAEQTINVPEISIILVIQNKAKNLFKIIDSIKNQTLKNWELVIVDNGSSDHPYNFIQPLFDKGLNVRYIRQQKTSFITAKNIGIRSSIGNYITFIGSDDKYLPDHLQSRVDFLKENKNIALIQGGFEVIGITKIPDYKDSSKKVSIYDTVLGDSFFGKKEVFSTISGFNELSINSDIDFWERAEKQFELDTIKQPVSYYHTRLA
ncbi:MAG: glycosyltransferase family A protein [Bacteroidota bacterium]